MRAVALSLGNPDRDFQKEPLDQVEIISIIHLYENELQRKDLDEELREIYSIAVENLKKSVIFH